jgi:hypothetical protein
MDEYLSRMRSVARHYIDSYVLSSRELQDTPEVGDAEVVRSIEEVLERYKRVLLQEKR